jgi:hypothetical protein
MKLEALHIGMRVRHPQYGEGTVTGLNPHAAEIEFLDAKRTVEPEAAGVQPAQAMAAVSGVTLPLTQLIHDTVDAAVQALGVERPDPSPVALGQRWHKGRLVLHPADPTLQTKEVPLETFFHKVVMVRNQLRVLEQKINAHEKLSDAEKIEMQQYITRSYGSLTTFNVLFKDKEDQF